MEATVSRRRSLFAAASAVVMGAGITAGAAASVADFAPTAAAEPDLDVILACAEFDKLERAIRAVGGHHRGEAEKVADRERKRLQLLQEPHLNRMCSLPVRTPAGASAIAASLLLYEAGELALDDDPHDYKNARMLSALVRGLVGRA